MVQAYQMPDPPREWGPWLTRVTVNLCHDRKRAGWWSWWRRRSGAVEALAVPDSGTMPDLAAIGQQARGRIWQTFRGLSARQREVFALRYLEGWSTQEVADALRLSPGSVKRHLFRGVQRMRAALGGLR